MTSPVATLLPLTSLRNFQAAVDFLVWLEKTGQSGWQMLPLAEPLATPYRSQGIGIASFFYDNRVPWAYRKWLLERSDFVKENRDWLNDFVLYRALARRFKTNRWWAWPRALAKREAQALRQAREEQHQLLEALVDEQYFLANQLLHLKLAAKARGITLGADLPFYLAQESSLVWANQSCFVLGEGGKLSLQSGVPANPDEPFGAQLWGHPLYNWGEVEPRQIIEIFVKRLKFLANFFDLVRLDHASGFFRYGIMSLDHPHWSRKVAGPGAAVVVKLLEKIEALDLGVYFEDTASENLQLEHFLKETGVAGMGVLTLMYNLENLDQKKASQVPDKFLKLSHLGGNKVLFSSTHDTPPLITWVKALPRPVRRRLALLNDLPTEVTDRRFAQELRERLRQQKARLIVIAWQDWQLDNFRFNVPGREDLTNWNYVVPIEKYL